MLLTSVSPHLSLLSFLPPNKGFIRQQLESKKWVTSYHLSPAELIHTENSWFHFFLDSSTIQMKV